MKLKITQEMKTVTYFGNDLLVPNWVKFIATDEDGEVCGYSHEPEYDDGVWTCEHFDQRSCKIGNADTTPNEFRVYPGDLLVKLDD